MCWFCAHDLTEKDLHAFIPLYDSCVLISYHKTQTALCFQKSQEQQKNYSFQKFYGIFSVCPQRISSKTSKILFWCQTVQVHRNIGQAILHVPTVVQIIMACCYYNFCFLSFLRRLQIRLSRLRLLDEPKVKINKSVVTDFPLSNPLSSASELITKWDTFLKLNWGFSPFFIFLILISVHC